MHMDKYVIGVTDFKSEVRVYLRGCLEAVVASEAWPVPLPYHISNMHMDKYVIGVSDLKSEVIFDLRGCLEDEVASDDAKSAHTM